MSANASSIRALNPVSNSVATALVEFIESFDVVATHRGGSSDDCRGVGDGDDGGQNSVPLRERISAVVHDGAVVVRSAQVVGVHLIEVVQQSWTDVVGLDSDVVVSVGARLLVVEAQGVKDLMLDHTGDNAPTLLEGDKLTSSLAAYIGPAPPERVEVQIVPMPPPPDEANTGDSVELHQAPDDDASLGPAVSWGDVNRHVDIASVAPSPGAAPGRARRCVPSGRLGGRLGDVSEFDRRPTPRALQSGVRSLDEVGGTLGGVRLTL